MFGRCLKVILGFGMIRVCVCSVFVFGYNWEGLSSLLAFLVFGEVFFLFFLGISDFM